MNEFDKIRNDGRLLYEYKRGSHLYGLNTETSDVDTSGVFICTADQLLG
ncbi:MAG: nucleotidyltransferase domain-containing protein, partial [Muribaculaceae bacterium]|nr:nucleotidyltransferase domain-containing protein [Muribaculaceae bacterium]